MIKKLVLQGFKSFNRKISIPFEKGITMITGPNGSGKSNIIDAICFVLGRISAKSMRADRLTELIFHGSEKKKAAEIASVSLHLDNKNKIFPFDSEEVIITRKINRRGFSIYKLNGSTVTREKILEVLSMARIYPDGHNIIMQGDVENIIEMNPLERKMIIDEICGIAEYNEKKEKAMRDLEVVNQKLREVEIVLKQREEILKKLEEDKEKAEKYRKLQNELIFYKASFWKRKEEILLENLKNLENAISKLEEELKNTEENITKIESEIETQEKLLKEIGEKIFNQYKAIEREKEYMKVKNSLELIESKIKMRMRELEMLKENLERASIIQQKIKEEDIPIPVKAILELRLKGVYGTFASIIKVGKEFENAIRVACANHYYDIVVEDFKTAKTCIEYLKENKIGRATFLPLDKIKGKTIEDSKIKDIEGYIGVASNLVEFDNKFRNVVEFVLGNTIVIKNLDVAEKIGIGSIRMVTLDGDLVERSGAVTGGYLIIKKSVEKEELKIDSLLKNIEEANEEIQKLNEEKRNLEKELKKFGEMEQISKDVENLEGLRKNSVLMLESLKDKRRKEYEKKIKIQNQINSLNFNKAKIETELESVRNELLQYKDVQNYSNKSLNEIENIIKKISFEINNLGSINFGAIEEYEKFKVQYDEIFQKFQKVMEERNAILKMIEEIESKRKETFLSTLNEINKNFNWIFKIFNGGEASLELEEKDNIDSGLLIKASFPGKTLINIDLLSGGEKTITALAFILAIQRYKPSPFYLFDEVDAALDKENTRNIYKIIKEFSSDSQFIIITHNEESLRFADVIYGVTMEDGESKILSIKVKE